MLRPGTKIKKVNDNAFQDIESKTEWVKKTRFIKFIVGKPEACINFGINNVYLDDIINPTKEIIKPDATIKHGIQGIVVKCKDKIYNAVKDKQESSEENLEHFIIQESLKNLRVYIHEAKSDVAKKLDFPDGVYYGYIMELEDEFGDYLLLQISVSSEQIVQLVQFLNSNPNSLIEIGVNITSYGLSIDDAWGEEWTSRDLLIEDGYAQALASWLEIKSDSLAPENNSQNIQNSQTSVSKEKSLKQVAFAVWAVVIVLMIHLFK